MKNIIIILITIIILFSCTKEVNIKIPDNGRKLTVNSFFSKDSNLVVSLLKSRHILDGTSTFENVENADISFFENDNLIEKLTELNAGTYKSNYILKEKNNYRIEVSSKGFPITNSKSYIPEKTEIVSISANFSVDEYGVNLVTFKLKFQDNPDVDSYYGIQLYQRNYPGEDIFQVNIESDDLNVVEVEDRLTKSLVMNGELIKGRLYSLLFTNPDGFYYDQPVTYFIYLYSVSKDYYLYYKSLSKHRANTDNFFSEPTQVYNNIENGFGIFAGYSGVVDSIVVVP